MKDQNTRNLSLTLRPARLADLESIQSLYVQTIKNTCKNDYDQIQRNAWKQGIENKERWEQAIENQYFLIAESNSVIVGFGSLMDMGYVDFLFTHKDHLRKGIAELIYEQLEKEALKHVINVLTSDVSITARGFFERQGFQVVEEKQNLVRGVEIINYRMQKTIILS